MIAYVTELTDPSFKDFVNKGLVLVDIKAVWCGPCKQLEPIIDEISNEFQGRVSVGKLDADKNPETVTELGVRSIPTLILYKDGEILERMTGMISKKKLADLLDQYL
jgi:thioredoxin 1